MPGDEEGDALRPDVAVGETLAGLAVDPGEHPPEQVGGVRRASLRPALGDEAVHQGVHERLVLLHLTLRAHLQPGLDRELAGPRLRLGERADHRLDERVRGLPVERVEAVPEPAERDGVEGQPGHVGGDVHLVLGVQSFPLRHELLRDVEHARHVVAHGLEAEGSHQDVVGPSPEWVVRLGCEQPVADSALAQAGRPR